MTLDAPQLKPQYVHIHIRPPTSPVSSGPRVLDAAWLRQLCLDVGADDVGFVELERPALAEERPHIERTFPLTRSLISFVVRMNRENVHSPARSVANTEFHQTGDEISDIHAGKSKVEKGLSVVCESACIH